MKEIIPGIPQHTGLYRNVNGKQMTRIHRDNALPPNIPRLYYTFCDKCSFKSKAYVTYIRYLSNWAFSVIEELPRRPQSVYIPFSISLFGLQIVSMLLEITTV